MELEGIIAIAGKPGLYKILSRSKSALVVESLVDGKKVPALATHKISALEDISMYTYEEDVPLKIVFGKIKKVTDGKAIENPKGNKEELESLFEQVLPDYDKERVYPSDLKKLYTWYNLLLDKGFLEGEIEEKPVVAEAEIIEESTEKEK